MSVQFKCFYEILKEALIGKVVVMRNYENDGEELGKPVEVSVKFVQD